MISDWIMEATHPRLWKGWQAVGAFYNITKEEAQKKAELMLPCYEGATRCRVKDVHKLRKPVKWFFETTETPKNKDKTMTLEAAKRTIDRYAKDRSAPGDFIQAILTNNLRLALQRGDKESIELLPQIFNYAWNELPGHIWGSPAAVKAHLEGPEIS
jgi:hypothetical protein